MAGSSEGSSWGKWDFHVHTPYSCLNNEFGSPEDQATWDKYFTHLDSVCREKNIVGLGITDYLIIDGFKKVYDHKQKSQNLARSNGKSEYFLKDVFIFPNIEFRLLPVTDKNHPVNIHCLISPECVDEIETSFLSHIEYRYDGENYYCTRQSLAKLGCADNKKLSISHPECLSEGINQFKVTLETLQNALEASTKIKEAAIIVVDNGEEDGASGVRQSGLSSARTAIYKFADAIFSPSQKDRDYFLGKGPDDESTIINKYNSLKPCIHGSDSHSFNNFCTPHGEKYCWIKAQPSWEGLKQILYEPESRVRIQRDNPETRKSNYTIAAVSIDETSVNDDLTISRSVIPLNRNLVTVIGGRGSGKTALLDILGSCFPDGKKLSQDTNKYSFINRVFSQVNRSKPQEKQIPVGINFLGGEEFNTLVSINTEPFIKADVLYLTQNHFDEYSANPNKLYGHILDLVFTVSRDIEVDFLANEDEISSGFKELKATINRIYELEEDFETNFPIVAEELNLNTGHIEDIRKQLDTLNEIKTDPKFTIIAENRKSLNGKRDNYVKIESFSNNIIESINNFASLYSLSANQLNMLLSQEKELHQLPESIQELGEIIDINNKNILKSKLQIPIINKDLDVLKTDLSTAEGVDKVITDLMEQLEAAEKDEAIFTQKLSTLKYNSDQSVELRSNLLLSFERLINQTLHQKELLQKAVYKFDKTKRDLLGNIRFISKIDYQLTDYFDMICADINNKTCGYKVDQLLRPLINCVISSIDSGDESYSDKNLLTRILATVPEYELKKNISKSVFTSHIFSRFFSNNIEITLADKELTKLSMGERSVVLLKILLSLDDKPLFIDQPEEHLDNRYIYTELVPAIRESKQIRQIILATHNANLVVNADAEQVIIAEYSNNTISYKSGALENNEIRKEIELILEGGTEAFTRREKKYHLNPSRKY